MRLVLRFVDYKCRAHLGTDLGSVCQIKTHCQHVVRRDSGACSSGVTVRVKRIQQSNQCPFLCCWSSSSTSSITTSPRSAAVCWCLCLFLCLSEEGRDGVKTMAKYPLHVFPLLCGQWLWSMAPTSQQTHISTAASPTSSWHNITVLWLRMLLSNTLWLLSPRGS